MVARKRYTEEETATLRELVLRRAGLSEAIAALQGRKLDGVADYARRKFGFGAWVAEVALARWHERRVSAGKPRGKSTPYTAEERALVRSLIDEGVDVYEAARRLGRPALGVAVTARRRFGFNSWGLEWYRDRDRMRYPERQREAQQALAEVAPSFRVTSRHVSPTSEIVEHTFCSSITDAETVVRSIPAAYMGGSLINTHILRRSHGRWGKWVPIISAVAA